MGVQVYKDASVTVDEGTSVTVDKGVSVLVDEGVSGRGGRLWCVGRCGRVV